MGMHARIFVSSQLEGSYVGDLLFMFFLLGYHEVYIKYCSTIFYFLKFPEFFVTNIQNIIIVIKYNNFVILVY